MSDIKAFLCAEADVTSLRSEWEKWFRSFKLYLQAEEITDVNKKRNKLLHLAGPQLQDVIYNIPGALVENVAEGGKDCFEILVDKLDEYFTPSRNSTFERHLFRAITAHENEDINKYLLRLRHQASKCAFGKTETEIIENNLKDKIIDSWAPVELRKKLLEKEMPLKEIVDACQMHQHILTQANKMGKTQQETVNKIFNQRNRYKSDNECGRCGSNLHKANDERCPAINARCNTCGFVGHFAKRCRTQTRKRKRPYKSNEFQKKVCIRCIDDDVSEPRETENRTDCLRICDDTELDVVTWCKIGGQPLQMVIDSGCRFNLIGESDWNLLKYKKAKMWNLRTKSENSFKAYATNQPLEVIQVFESTVAVNNQDALDTFYVIKNGNQSLLGRNAAVRLQVLKLGSTVNNVKYVAPFPKIKNIQIKLSIDPAVKPIQQPLRRIPVAVEDRVEQRLEEALMLDIIEKVKGPSEWISPIVPVFRENGELRLCVDMRQANKAVRRENYTLPTFEIFMTKLRGANIFSRLDLKWAYHQIELAEQSRYITTFITHKGLYRYKRLMFGINSAPEIFQRVIETSLAGCANVLNYIDDIIVFGPSISVHNEALSRVLQVLKQNNVQLNDDKCVWRSKEIKFLGHVLSDKGIAPDPAKIQTIMEFREPITKEEVRSFLGLVTYVGKFMTDLATTTEPLRRLIKMDVKFEWEKREQSSFDLLKEQLSKLPTLSYFDPALKTRVIADASPVALGAVLLQFSKENEPLITSFASKSLSAVERKYSQTEKESLALVWAVERFFYYLAGREFELVTDHKPLEAIFKPISKPPARIERWLLRLQAFKFKVIYKSGKSNIADPLSRLCQIDNKSPTISHCEQGVFSIVKAATPSSVSIQQVLISSERDAEIVEAIEHLQNDSWPQNIKNVYFPFRHELSSVASMLLRGTRLVIPKDLRTQVLGLAHEGHPGESAMKRRLRAKVWWPLIDQEVVSHVKKCKECQLVSRPDNPPPMKRTVFPNGPWQCVAADLLGPLPNNNYVFVLIDYYSRYQEIKFTERITSEAIVHILREIFSRLGIPKTLRADNGRQFVSSEFKAFCGNNNIELISTTPYWPQANGEVENMNRAILKRLKIAHLHNEDYVEEIQKFILMHNVTPHSTTGSTPSELMFNRTIRDKIPCLNDITDGIWDSAARDSDLINKSKGKSSADKRRGAKDSNVKVGDKVLIKNVIFPNKLSTAFDMTEYVVTSRKGDEVVVVSGDKTYRRHVSHVKKCSTGQDGGEAQSGLGNELSAEREGPLASTAVATGNSEDQDERPPLILKLKNKEGMWQPSN